MAKPINSFRFGPVSLSVFENDSKDGTFKTKSFVLNKNYKTADGVWKTTNNFKIGELVNVIQVAQAALSDYYTHTKSEPAPGRDNGVKTLNPEDVPF